MNEAIILSGGFGTRLRSVHPNLPKGLARIGNKSILELIIAQLEHKGVSRIILSLGYMAESIISHLKSAQRSSELIFVKEESPLGTGGAIKLALSYAKSERVLVLNGDTYIDLNLEDILQVEKRTKKNILIGVMVSDVSRYGALKIKGTQIIGFYEKGCIGRGPINGGCYVLNKNILDEYPPLKNFSFEKECLEIKVAENQFEYYENQGYFIDIGVPEDLLRAQSDSYLINKSS